MRTLYYQNEAGDEHPTSVCVNQSESGCVSLSMRGPDQKGEWTVVDLTRRQAIDLSVAILNRIT